MEVKILQKNAKFVCNYCDFKAFKQCDWDRHVNTKKHSHRVSGSKMEVLEIPKSPKFGCECGKKFITHSGMWKHKQKCGDHNANNTNNTNTNNNNNTNIIDILLNENKIMKDFMIEQNHDFKTLIMELVKKDNISNNIISNNTINSNNKTFNLSLFLNETCKDALNIGEFVDSIKVQLTDLETFGHSGYVEGVSKILIKNLNELETCKRPIHCSDSKRDVLYIKDDNKWCKENDDKLVIKKAIRDVSNKNIKQITEWTNLNPDCKKSDSRKNDQYLKIVMNSMSGGSNEEQCNNVEKIIKNITKSVIIDK